MRATLCARPIDRRRLAPGTPHPATTPPGSFYRILSVRNSPPFLEGTMDVNIGYLPVVFLLLAGYAAYWYWTRDPRRAHLPPHVRGWPIINQTLAHLNDDPTEQIIGWARRYGEIFRTTSATTTFIWLNSREAFKELIDRRSAIYSSRHPQPLVLDVASGGKRITFMPYGKDWRAMRNIIHRVIWLFRRPEL
jgi:hypothetical protein